MAKAKKRVAATLDPQTHRLGPADVARFTWKPGDIVLAPPKQ